MEAAGRAGGGKAGRRVLDSLQPGSGSAKQGEPVRSAWRHLLSHWPCAAGGGLGRPHGLACRAGARSGPLAAPLLRGGSCEEPCRGHRVVKELKKPEPRGTVLHPRAGRGQIGAFWKQMEEPGTC